MKLLSSIRKELILATRSFYFYIEILFAVILLAVLLFAIPEHARPTQDIYVYLDMPQQAADAVRNMLLDEDVDGQAEQVVLTFDGIAYPATLIGKENENQYLLQSAEAVRTLADSQRKIGAVVSIGGDSQLHYTYYLQGYETQRLKNLLSVLHNVDSDVLEQRFDAQPVRALQGTVSPLNDRQNALPPLLAFNSSLMGMFIMAAYVFLDKKEGVIRAYAVTASSVWRYLASKTVVMLITGVVTTLVVTLPVMGFGAHYGLLLVLQLASGFFAATCGLLIASFYQDIAKSFGVIFTIMVLMMLPAFSYFLPGWSPVWVKLIPSHALIQGFQDALLPDGNASFVLLAAAGFAAAGGVLFGWTNARFQKALGV
jgi:hypothetical protein